MIVLGLTGGIASGKSTISKMLKEKGIPIIDADLIAREIVKPESLALKLIEKEFGNEMININGQLNRKKLASIVFKDASKLEILNSITHPMIKQEIANKINYYKMQDYQFCVVDVANLIEANFTDLVEYIILVYVDEKQQLERIMRRDHFSEQDALHRINAQMSFERKAKLADFIIDNSKDVEYTKQQVNRILSEIVLSEEIDV